MTNKECKYELIKMLAFVASARQQEALNLAIYLIERADAQYTEFVNEVGYACPRCGTFNICDQDGNHCDFCPDCGQRLRWKIDELEADDDQEEDD